MLFILYEDLSTIFFLDGSVRCKSKFFRFNSIKININTRGASFDTPRNMIAVAKYTKSGFFTVESHFARSKARICRDNYGVREKA